MQFLKQLEQFTTCDGIAKSSLSLTQPSNHEDTLFIFDETVKLSIDIKVVFPLNKSCGHLTVTLFAVTILGEVQEVKLLIPLLKVSPLISVIPLLANK